MAFRSRGNFGTMAGATLNGRAKMRGLRYLKSRSQASIAAVQSGQPLWKVALDALTSDSRYESSTHPTTAPCTVASELPAAPCSVSQLPVAGTGRGKPQPVGTRGLCMGHWECVKVRMNIFERRTANRALSLGISPITNILSDSQSSFAKKRFPCYNARASEARLQDNAGTIDSDNRESRWHCIRRRLGRNMTLIYDHLLRRIDTGNDKPQIPAHFLGAQPVQLPWDMLECQHRSFKHRSFCSALLACDIFECWRKACTARESLVTHTYVQTRVTLNGNIIEWQGSPQLATQPVFASILRCDSTNPFFRIGVRPFVFVFLPLLSGRHTFIFLSSFVSQYITFGFYGSRHFWITVQDILLVAIFTVTVLGLRRAIQQCQSSTSTAAMPAKGRDRSMVGTMAALEKQRSEADKAKKEAERRERVLSHDPHDLQSVKDEAERRREQQEKNKRAQAAREVVQRSRQEETRQQVAEANRLLDGIQRLSIDTKLPASRFDAASASVYKALTTGHGRIPHLEGMTRVDFTATMKLALQASVFKATMEDQQSRLTRSLQALDDEGWPNDMRMFVIAENVRPGKESEGGLTKSHIHQLFRKAAPGSVELNNIVQFGGITKSEQPTATGPVFQVMIRNTALQQGDLLGLLRTTQQEGVCKLKDSDGMNQVEAIITAETKWDITVSLQSDDQRYMAQNFIKVCNALGLDKFTRDNILTQCVRSAAGWSRWSEYILWVRFQREKRERNEKITLHEDDWGATGFPRSFIAPNIIINVATEKVREEIAELKPSVVFRLGVKDDDLVTVRGIVSTRPRGQGVAGVEAARLRAGEVMKQLTSAGDNILERLTEASIMALNGQGREAGDAIRECKLRAMAVKDCTAKFLQGKVQQLVESLNACGGNLSEDNGRALRQSCNEWKAELGQERETLGQDWQGITLQLRSFPEELPKVAGERNNWWKFPNAPEGLREQLWALLTRVLEIPGVLCAEPIMDAKGLWSKGEGVIVVIQLREAFVQRCEPKQGSTAKPAFLPFFPAASLAGAARKMAKLRVLWSEATSPALNDNEVQLIKAQIQELLLKGFGFWIPKTVEISNEEVQVFLQGEQDQAPLHLSALGEARGQYDIRTIPSVLERSRDACENVLEVIGNLRQQGQIAPVCEKEGLTLFIAKDFVDAFLEHPDFDVDNGGGRLTFMDAVMPGNNVQ